MKWTTATSLLSLLPFLASAAPVAQKDASDLPVTQPVQPAQGYIITLKPGIAVNESETHLAWVGDLQRRGLARRQENGEDLKTFDLFSFQGYAGVFDDETISEIAASDEVCRPPLCSD